MVDTQKYFYPCGKEISPLVLEMVTYMGKVGVMSTKAWHRYFGVKGHRWRQKQLLTLQKRDYLRAYAGGVVPAQWILGRRSIDLLSSLKRICVTPMQPRYLDHDSFIGESMLTLERAGIAKLWTTERELKIKNEYHFQLSSKDGRSKYPDSVMQIDVSKGTRTVGLEYERTGKSPERYRSILWQYAKLDLNAVIFICQDETIEKRILQALKYIGSGELNVKIAFVNAHSWQQDPVHTGLKFQSKSSSFYQICAS